MSTQGSAHRDSRSLPGGKLTLSPCVNAQDALVRTHARETCAIIYTYLMSKASSKQKSLGNSCTLYTHRLHDNTA
jgi:hypothetical protein